MRLDDEALSMFLDGELTAPQDQAIGRRVDSDPLVARRYGQFQDADAAACQWFASALYEAPQAQIEVVRRGFSQRKLRKFRSVSRIYPAAIAASIAALVLVGADYEFDRRVRHAVESSGTDMRADLLTLQSAIQEALELRPSGTEVSYVEEHTGTKAVLVPSRTWRSRSGHWCREFLHVVANADPSQTSIGVACRDPSSGWQLIATEPPNSIPRI